VRLFLQSTECLTNYYHFINAIVYHGIQGTFLEITKKRLKLLIGQILRLTCNQQELTEIPIAYTEFVVSHEFQITNNKQV